MKSLVLWSLIFFSIDSFATQRFEKIDDFLDHIESLSPDVVKARVNLEVVRARRVQAAQIPNPEVSVGNWSGKARSQTWKQTDVTLTQPFELGGKRKNRITLAEAEAKESQLDFLILSAEVRLKVLFSLFRIRQIKDEITTISEARQTFRNLVASYKKRPQLNPEQSTSLFVFGLTVNEYELLLEEVTTELNFLEADLKLLTGAGLEAVENILPPRIKKWPVAGGGGELNSLSLQALSARVETSKQELELAKADVWPTISIGPSYTMQNQFGDQANILGVVVNLPLPILNQNRGAKAIATQKIIANRRFVEVEKNVLNVRRFALLRSYTSSSKILESQRDTNFKRDHGRIEQNFLRGLLNSSLVIESHRQNVDAQKLFHARELKALDYYYQLVLLDGGKIRGILP